MLPTEGEAATLNHTSVAVNLISQLDLCLHHGQSCPLLLPHSSIPVTVLFKHGIN